MKKITADDTRRDAIRKFDDSMDELFRLTASFVEEVKRITVSDENKIKIYTLGLNFSIDVTAIAENVVAYSHFIRNSLLSIRYEKHKDYLDRIKVELNEVRQMAINISNSAAIGIEDEVDGDKEKYHNGFMNEYRKVSERDPGALASYNALNWYVCNAFSLSGYTCYEEILKGINSIENTLSELLVVNHSRNDNDYEVLYNTAMDEFYSSNNWTQLQKGYINSFYNNRLKRVKPTLEFLDKQKGKIYDWLSEDKEIGFLWEANSDNKTKLAKEIINKEFEDDKNLIYLFEHLGKLKILEDWEWDLKFELTPIDDIVDVPDEYDIAQSQVTFIGDFTEDTLRIVWDDIYKYMMENKDSAYAWCCLHHIMTCYNLIELTTFSIFMKWLNGFAGEELISDNNIRQCTSDYFVKNVNKKWTLEDMKSYLEEFGDAKNKYTEHKRTKLIKYRQICEDLIGIFRNMNK